MPVSSNVRRRKYNIASLTTSTLSLQLTAKREATLLHEFRAAIDATSRRDLQAWGGRTVDVLGRVAVRQGKNFASLASRIGGFVSDEALGLLAALRRNDVLSHLRARGTAAAEGTQALGQDFVSLYKTFSSNLRNRPGEAAPKVVAGVLGFLVGSGGVGGDGGIPDLDFLGGVGAHRSILTHSVVSGIVVETLVLSFLDLSKTVYRNLSEEHDRFWEDLNAASDDVFAALTTGISLGIAHHLAIDATIDGDGTYKDLPVSIPAEGHQAILAANAVVEGGDAAKRALETKVDEIKGKVFNTFREAAEFAKRDRGWVIVRATEAQGFRVLRKVTREAKPPLTARSKGRA